MGIFSITILVVYEFPNDVRGFVFPANSQVADTYSENFDYFMGSEGFGNISGLYRSHSIKGKETCAYHEDRAQDRYVLGTRAQCDCLPRFAAES